MATPTKPRPIVSTDFYKLAFVSDPQISPNGKHVAYVRQVTSKDGKGYQSAIWVCDVDGKNKRQFTLGAHRDHTPRWSPDGTRLVFVSTRNGRPQLWLIALAGGEALPQTHLATGAVNPAWSPNGEQIMFSSFVNDQERAEQDKNGVDNTPLSDSELKKRTEDFKRLEAEKTDPRVIERTIYRSGTEYFDDRQSHVFVLTVSSGEITRVSRGRQDVVNPHWSADGKTIFASIKKNRTRDDSPDWHIVSMPSSGGKTTKLIEVRGWAPHALPSPDGKRLAYTHLPHNRGTEGHSHLMVASVNGKSPKYLPAEFGTDIYQLAWSRDSKFLYATAGRDGDLKLHTIHAQTAQIDTVLDGTRMVRSFSLAAKADQMAYLISTPAYPCDVFTSSSKGNQEKQLTHANRQFLDERHVQRVEEMWYKSDDGTKIQGWVIKPPNFKATKKYPLAVEIHGGPHAMWSSSETTMWHEWQLLASAGYVVFFCNPRGSEGYGFEFKDAIHNDWGTFPTQDIMSGVQKVVDRGYIDTNKICVTGGSYGGYMTAWLIGHRKDFCAAVAQRGVYDLLSFYGTTDVPRLIEWEFDTFPWDDPMKLWEHSPIAHAKKMRTPLLILHSERDFRAPIPSAEGMYMALKKLNRKVKFVRFPEEGHELSRSGQPNRIVSRLDHILGWFDEHTTSPKSKK